MSEYSTIVLTRGQVTIVDTKFLEALQPLDWYAHKVQRRQDYYAVRSNRITATEWVSVKMHRFILELAGFNLEGLHVDHINRNTLDNRSCNLRSCTPAQNQHNRGKVNFNTSSRFKGVDFQKRDSKWRARATTNKKIVYLGLFDTEEDAARAYNDFAIKTRGSFARLNEI